MHADPHGGLGAPLSPLGSPQKGGASGGAHVQVIAALDAVLAARPGADEWLLTHEDRVVQELCEVFLAGGDAATVPRRQLAGVILTRRFAKAKPAPVGLVDTLLQYVTKQQDDRTLLQSGCDMLCSILKQDPNTPPQALIAQCAGSDPHDAVANRILHGLATNKDGPLLACLYEHFVLPFLSAASGAQLRSPRLSVAAHIVQQRPASRAQIAKLLPRVCADLQQTPAEYIACADALQCAVLCAMDADLGVSVYTFAITLLQYYGPRIAAGRATQQENRFANVYSEMLAVHAALHACSHFVSSAAPNVLLQPVVLQSLVEAAVVDPDALDDDDDREYEDLDCSLTFDVPAGVRSAAVWLVSCLLKDPDDDGPAEPIPNATDAVMQFLTTVVCGGSAAAQLVESALFFMQKLAECGIVDAKLVPVQALLQLAGGAHGGSPPVVAARACLALSGIANRSLTPAQHAELINHQWGRVCAKGAVDDAVRIMAGVGLGRAVAHTCNNPGTIELVRIGPSLAPLLALLPEAPALLLESLDSILQILGGSLLSPEQVEAVMTCLLGVLQQHSKNTRLCERVLRVICQAVIDEHQENPVVCGSVVRCSSFVMESVLQQQHIPEMQALCHAALDVASALVGCPCSCSSVAPRLSHAIATLTNLETKLAVRAACAALTYTTTAAVRQAGGGGMDTAAHVRFLEHYMSSELDLQTQGSIASCALSLSGFVPLPALSALAQRAMQRVGEFWGSRADWSWPTQLSVLWAALVVRSGDVQQSLAGLGSTPAQQVECLAAWLTLDAVLEPKVRPTSATAAHLLLTKLPSDYLTCPVNIVPVKTLHRRKRDTVPIAMQLGDALLMALHRIVEKPPTPFSLTFLAKETKALPLALPSDPQIQTHAVAIVSGLDAAKRQAVEQYLKAAACK